MNCPLGGVPIGSGRPCWGEGGRWWEVEPAMTTPSPLICLSKSSTEMIRGAPPGTGLGTVCGWNCCCWCSRSAAVGAGGNCDANDLLAITMDGSYNNTHTVFVNPQITPCRSHTFGTWFVQKLQNTSKLFSYFVHKTSTYGTCNIWQ